jgi:hypothetical protein
MDQLIKSLSKLERAISKGTNVPYCLKLWSNFIRQRDNNRCVICHSRNNLNAHHIIRKSFIPQAQYQTGNGITLCKICHHYPHQFFNKKPDLDFPMDAQNGEKIDLIISLFGFLIQDAKERKLLNKTYYFLSEELLMAFKSIQGIPHDIPLSESCIEQAYLIWKQTPRQLLNALINANGFCLPSDFIQTSPFTLISSSQVIDLDP